MILVAESERFSAQAVERLRTRGEVVLGDLDRAGLIARIGSATGLWVRLRNTVDREVLDAAPSLQWIATATTGLNHIDLEACAERGIRVFSLKGEVEFLEEICATAEHTIGLLLALLRHIPAAVEQVREGGWDRDALRGREIHRKTVGLVGYGRLGRLVARRLVGFGCTVLATDPGPAMPEPWVQLVDRDTLLEHSDIVSLHVSLDSDTSGFFDAACFAAMKPGAVLINTSRGELLDEAALADALRSGRLAGAALDVLSGEDATGMADHPLVRLARVGTVPLLITPHIGGATGESMAKTEDFLVEQILDGLG